MSNTKSTGLDQSREKRMSVDRTKSLIYDTRLSDVLKHVKENNGDLDSVYFDYHGDCDTHGYVMFFAFTSPETDEEWAQRLKEMDEAKVREEQRRIKEAADKKLAKKKKEEKERAEYERLKAKFETGAKNR